MDKKHKFLATIIVLILCVVLTTVFIFAVTFAGDANTPDAVATYTMNNLKWNIPEDANGVAQLNIFGEPEEGEELPLIHPFSKGSSYIRLKNDEPGNINYYVYIYYECDVNVPVKFEVIGAENGYDDTVYLPSELEGKKLIEKASGTLKGRDLKNFEIKWYWDTETDKKDTEIGNKAVDEDIIYKAHVMIVVEDNNSYRSSQREYGTARLLHRSYVIGYPEGDFRQNGNMNRAETAAIFARIHADYNEDNLKSKQTTYTDTDIDSWYIRYVARMQETGIMQGYPDNTFDPYGSITRAEFATTCVRFTENRAGKIKKASIDFSDLDKSHWGYEYIQKAVEEGYVVGYPDGTVKPDDFITRAEVVTVVNRMLNRRADKKFVDENLDKLMYFTDLTDNTYWAYYEIYEAANQHNLSYDKNFNETWYGWKETK